MSTLIFEPHTVRRAPYWATTTTTTGRAEIFNVSLSSEKVPDFRTDIVFLLVGNVHRGSCLLPTHSEAFSRRFAFPEEHVSVSSAAPFLKWCERQLLYLKFGDETPRLLPSPLKEEDVLNWDATIDPAPQRLTGEIKITLKYAGRDIPMPADDPWE